MESVPDLRIRPISPAPVLADGRYVLYWMVAQRRLHHNFALQRAVLWARELNRPLVILEALRCDYPWASDRLHRFILEGMVDHARVLEGTAAWYYPFVEKTKGEGKGLLESLAQQAAVVVTDDYPAFFLPRMLQAAATRLAVRCEAVDSNGLLPMREPGRIFPTAHLFRRYLQRHLLPHLAAPPAPDPLDELPNCPPAQPEARILEHWRRSELRDLERTVADLSGLPIDHSVAPALLTGGPRAAEAALARFVAERLDRYPERRNHPDEQATSGLSPYLHFGHISAHRVFAAVVEREGWTPAALAQHADGRRQGWWNLSAAAEAFVDQLITWRELGFNRCAQDAGYARFDALPAWAQETLQRHRHDPRPYRYDLERFAQARTHDRLWNAAQTQLLREGIIHNYLRMLWGKKILHWTADPEEALAIMLELNDRYALDGRDPNSVTGIFWILGRYDRPWGPERPVFGKVRFMSSKSTAAKLRLKRYLESYGGE